MPRPRRDAPSTFSADWPSAACSDPDAEVLRRIAVNLRAAIGDRSLRSVAADSGIHHSLVAKVLDGQAWVEVVTVARLERGLGARLWPDTE
ncbi:XRE family transcriptional regulator [Aeromicrobium sp. A1-2]|uniref:XRE family transcriptional regulator n=1 Tax=Aeromicrobium sp. A1-2 TaxID=2107713 RepID=UPI000E4D8A21|nr:XRE family transcriptional regulator [Aeromicrobium sp. A1-2]AXT86255.1 XRE family transcriptional regulator [Aeromicrobium sp. A1-2]